MRYAVISDIHSNLEALQCVIDDIKKENVDKVICCGDIIGYGPNPKECIELISGMKNAEVIMGNHDAAVADKIDTSTFNKYAKKAIKINRSLLSDGDITYLSALKYAHREVEILFVHGSPSDPIIEYLNTLTKLRENITVMKERICIVGHTHVPMVFSMDGAEKGEILALEKENTFILKDENKYIINAGSVGQPRDGDNRSCFIYLDTEKKMVTFRRLKYDIEKVQENMKEVDLPEYLANRLYYGK